jgi:general secretion pathway protein B
MSYILDALRRADAEREQGAVPHLHTQAMPVAQPEADDSPRAPRHWLWLAAGLALGLLAALVWVIGDGREARPELQSPGGASPAATVPTVAQPVAPATDAAPAAQAGPAPADGATRTAATPAVTPSIVPRSLATAASPVATRPARATAPAAAPGSLAASVPAAVAPSRDSAAANGAPASGPPHNDTPVRPRAELPADVLRELPQLTVGGSMYSENAASRMIIVNGQLLREGDAVTPTITLEQIRLRSAVLRYKTYRYEIGF